MIRTKRFGLVALAAMFVVGFASGQLVQSEVAQAQSGGVFELRTYTAADGKLDDLQRRFRDHTLRLFERNGMKNVGYWVPTDSPLSENTLIYLLQYDSRDAAEKSWQDFRDDPDWQKAFEESQRDGRLVSNVESVFMSATDYSPMK